MLLRPISIKYRLCKYVVLAMSTLCLSVHSSYSNGAERGFRRGPWCGARIWPFVSILSEHNSCQPQIWERRVTSVALGRSKGFVLRACCALWSLYIVLWVARWLVHNNLSSELTHLKLCVGCFSAAGPLYFQASNPTSTLFLTSICCLFQTNPRGGGQSPSEQIPNLELKRGQYQDFGFVRTKRQRNVASKRRYLRDVWKEPCRGWGFVTFVTFLRFFDILGFAKKTIKKNIPCDKNLEMSQSLKSVTLWHLEMSQNVTKCHTFSNLWYKATFTFYVWIWLGTTLTQKTSFKTQKCWRFDKFTFWESNILTNVCVMNVMMCVVCAGRTDSGGSMWR